MESVESDNVLAIDFRRALTTFGSPEPFTDKRSTAEDVELHK